MKTYLTQADVAEIYQVGTATLRRNRRLGKGPAFTKTGRKFLYRAEDVARDLSDRALQRAERNQEWVRKSDLPMRAGSEPTSHVVANALYRSPLVQFDFTAASILGLPIHTFIQILDAGVGPERAMPAQIGGYYVFVSADWFFCWKSWFENEASDCDFDRIAEFLGEEIGGAKPEDGQSSRDFVFGVTASA